MNDVFFNGEVIPWVFFLILYLFFVLRVFQDLMHDFILIKKSNLLSVKIIKYEYGDGVDGNTVIFPVVETNKGVRFKVSRISKKAAKKFKFSEYISIYYDDLDPSRSIIKGEADLYVYIYMLCFMLMIPFLIIFILNSQ